MVYEVPVQVGTAEVVVAPVVLQPESSDRAARAYTE
jgi:hypothetical protein